MEVSSTGFEPFTAPPDRTQLSREDFMKVLLTQLTTQDPTEPIDNEKMMGQIVQLQQMDNSNRMNVTMENLSTQFALMRFQTEFTSAAAFVGKSVKGFDLLNREVEGQVIRVSVEGSEIVTWVKPEEGEAVAVPFNSIVEVFEEAPQG